jgi:hypothetical protein
LTGKRKIFVLMFVCLSMVSLASADVFNINADNGAPGCTSVNSCGTVTVTFSAGVVHVAIATNSPYGVFGNNDTFGFNVVGTTTGVTMSNFSNGLFNGNGGSGNEDGWGSFAFRVDGPGGSSAVSSLSFDVTRTGDPFTSTADIEAGQSGSNAPGFTVFALHVRDNTSGNTGFAGVGQATPQVPEPASLMLMGSGLGLLATRFRRRK